MHRSAAGHYTRKTVDVLALKELLLFREWHVLCALCFDRVQYGAQSVGPSAAQHHIPQQVPKRRWVALFRSTRLAGTSLRPASLLTSHSELRRPAGRLVGHAGAARHEALGTNRTMQAFWRWRRCELSDRIHVKCNPWRGADIRCSSGSCLVFNPSSAWASSDAKLHGDYFASCKNEWRWKSKSWFIYYLID